MIATLISVALLNVGLTTENGDASSSSLALPDPPETQVLDRMEWLSEERRTRLDTELQRVQEEHGIDLFVVVWDRRLPDGEGPEEFARRIGSSWNRGRVWGVVFLTPGSISTPYVVTGGPALTTEDSHHLKAAAVYSREFGARAWSDPDRLQQTALTLAEELVFAAHAIIPPDTATGGQAVISPPADFRRALLPVPIVIAIGVLTVLLAMIVITALRRRSRADTPGSSAPDSATPVPAAPAQPVAPATEAMPVRHFATPPTTTSLGAPWCSGASLMVTLPESPPQ